MRIVPARQGALDMTVGSLLVALFVIWACGTKALAKDRDPSGSGYGEAAGEIDLADILYALPAPSEPHGGLYYRTPLIKHAPDPDLLRASDGRYYLYPTGGGGYTAYESTDL